MKLFTQKIGLFNPNKAVVTDFETFFDSKNGYTLRGQKGMRYEEYILDRRFHAHGVAVAYPNGKTDFIDNDDVSKWLKSYRDYAFINHRMHFDALIWKLRYNHVAPFMVDTLALANAVFGPAEVSGGNDLGEIAERLGLKPKGHVEMFDGLREMSPHDAEALAAYARNDADITFQAAHLLLPRLSRLEFELWLIDHTLRIYVDRPLLVNKKTCLAAIDKVEKRVNACCNSLPKISFDSTTFKPRSKQGIKYKEKIVSSKAVDESVLASNTQFGQLFLQLLAKHKVKVPMKMGKKGLIPALAKNDEGFVALKASPIDEIRNLVIARLAKRSGDTQIARLRTLAKCADLGGFRVWLNYWGAHTGRWSGGSGLNAQNMPNPTRSPDEFEREVAALIRACIRAGGSGTVFVATDAANIEARVLAWWAGETELVDAFGTGSDVYSEFASETFKEEVRKPREGDPKEKATRFKLLRNVGKASILGLGYSMGAPKFEKNLRASPDVRQLFVDGLLGTDKCESIVRQYRKRYDKIVALWGRSEVAFFKALAGESRAVNGVVFAPGPKRSVEVHLPSGRMLRYPAVRIGEHGGDNRGRKQWVYGHGKGKKIYGGLLVENIVQAISRDILAEGVYMMEQEGYPVAYHVHDSIVCAVPVRKAQKCMTKCIDVLSAAPEWGMGMRLGAESAVEESFT